MARAPILSSRPDDPYGFAVDFLSSPELRKAYEVERLGNGKYGTVYKVSVYNSETRLPVTYAVKKGVLHAPGGVERRAFRMFKPSGESIFEEVVRFMAFFSEWLAVSYSSQSLLIKGLAFRTNPPFPDKLQQELARFMGESGREKPQQREGNDSDCKLDGEAIACAIRNALKGEIEIEAYIVMEYFEGMSLGQWFRLHETDLVNFDVMSQILCLSAMCIRKLSDMNLVHNDLKPDNILFNERTKMLKICDVGGMHHIQLPCYFDVLSKDYSAPERIDPKSKAPENQGTHYSDVYSLGRTLLRLKPSVDWSRLENSKYEPLFDRLIAHMTELRLTDRPNAASILQSDGSYQDLFDQLDIDELAEVVERREHTLCIYYNVEYHVSTGNTLIEVVEGKRPLQHSRPPRNSRQKPKSGVSKCSDMASCCCDLECEACCFGGVSSKY